MRSDDELAATPFRGELVIAPRFEHAGPFREGRAAVREAGRDFEIGLDGTELP